MWLLTRCASPFLAADGVKHGPCHVAAKSPLRGADLTARGGKFKPQDRNATRVLTSHAYAPGSNRVSTSGTA